MEFKILSHLKRGAREKAKFFQWYLENVELWLIFSWKIVVGFDAIWNKKWTLSSYFLTSPSNFLYCLENMGPLAFL